MSLNNYLYIVLFMSFGLGIFYTSQSEEKRLSKISKLSAKEEWATLPFGELIVKVGKEFIGVPYVGGTLDKDEAESCTIDLEKLDCVTFFEVTIAIADAVVTEDKLDFAPLYDRVQYSRYRGGNIDGYESRLHYTADWIFDNVEKGVVNDITADLGGVPLKLNVFFMSKNSDKYPKLKGKKDLIKKIKAIEDDINASELYYIPKDNISDIMDQLESGDIIAIVTSIDGLDYGHVGLINKEDGTARLMHASTAAKKVVLDKPLDEYLDGVSKFTGITVLRPIEPLK